MPMSSRIGRGKYPWPDQVTDGCTALGRCCRRFGRCLSRHLCCRRRQSNRGRRSSSSDGSLRYVPPINLAASHDTELPLPLEDYPILLVVTSHGHPLFKLPQVYQNVYRCDICDAQGRNWVYHCDMCNFDAHLPCAMKDRRVEPPLRPSQEDFVILANPVSATEERSQHGSPGRAEVSSPRKQDSLGDLESPPTPALSLLSPVRDNDPEDQATEAQPREGGEESSVVATESNESDKEENRRRQVESAHSLLEQLDRRLATRASSSTATHSEAGSNLV